MCAHLWDRESAGSALGRLRVPRSLRAPPPRRIATVAIKSDERKNRYRAQIVALVAAGT
jgi:hypothetical protein